MDAPQGPRVMSDPLFFMGGSSRGRSGAGWGIGITGFETWTGVKVDQ